MCCGIAYARSACEQGWVAPPVQPPSSRASAMNAVGEPTVAPFPRVSVPSTSIGEPVTTPSLPMQRSPRTYSGAAMTASFVRLMQPEVELEKLNDHGDG